MILKGSKIISRIVEIFRMFRLFFCFNALLLYCFYVSKYSEKKGKNKGKVFINLI